MARKKGRPPKSPSPAATPISSIPKNLDLENLDDEDHEDIDALSPKKASSILRKLDALRSRIKGKAIEDDKEGNNSDAVPNQPDITKLRNAGEKLIKEVIQNQCEDVSVVNESQMESGEVQTELESGG
ncbi:hypothetical protein RIF29_10478 [Crotalaria pallida]|uniref:Uncharacterized protein n=1 Tax=Crotalaria pallida TaxID=3830 RepID=A0AAN9FST3_CROPI